MTIRVTRHGDPRHALAIAQALVDAAHAHGGCTLRPTPRHFEALAVGVPVGGQVKAYEEDDGPPAAVVARQAENVAEASS
jgi:hypothetical protein